ncbi:MAG: flagellar motor switch protein FliG [Methylococcaceae bacterium]|nr:flagellar motor switch protein FliG [Methylococcaceae bacterium]
MNLDLNQKAAVLLLSIGQDRAGAILKHMEGKEVQLLGTTMSSLGTITPDMVDIVLEDFITQAKNFKALGANSEDYIKNMLTSALGEEKASSIVKRISLGASNKGMGQLRWLEPRAIADLIRLEHPQIIAIILSLLEVDQAAEVLGYMPQPMQANLMMRIATLESVQPSALRELDDIMDMRLSGSEGIKSSVLGGVDKVASIINFLEGAVSDTLMEEITENDTEMAQQIQDRMFVFEDLGSVDDRSIQGLMREISTDQLLLALRGVDDELKEKIFKNMSRRAAEMLRDDLAASRPAKLSDVEAAQKDILAIAKKLADAGQITLVGTGVGEALV